MKIIRPWTTLEERRAVELRRQRHTITFIARTLNRTYSCVSVKLCRLRATRARPSKRPRGGFLAAVRRACRPGRSDREVAAMLGSTHQEVYKARRKLGIPAGVTLSEAANRRNAIRYSPHRCFVCNRRKPFRDSAWKLRRILRAPNAFFECYCPTCFDRHGWPPVPRRAGKPRKYIPQSAAKRVYSLMECA